MITPKGSGKGRAIGYSDFYKGSSPRFTSASSNSSAPDKGFQVSVSIGSPSDSIRRAFGQNSDNDDDDTKAIRKKLLKRRLQRLRTK